MPSARLWAMWVFETHPKSRVSHFCTRMYGGHTLPEILVFVWCSNPLNAARRYSTIHSRTPHDTQRYALFSTILNDFMVRNWRLGKIKFSPSAVLIFSSSKVAENILEEQSTRTISICITFFIMGFYTLQDHFCTAFAPKGRPPLDKKGVW